MSNQVILITGANGEIGHGLIRALCNQGIVNILALDIHPISAEIQDKIQDNIIGSILDRNLLKEISNKYKITIIYHLAALLSTQSEHTPRMAHEVNVTGTINLLDMAVNQGRKFGEIVKFLKEQYSLTHGYANLIAWKSK